MSGSDAQEPSATILVVEDDAQVRAFLEELLALDGHEVHVAGDGRDALERLATLRPDLVITDLVMPEKDGVELVLQIRERDPDLPILAISGGRAVPGESYLRVARMLGADAIMEKPFAADELRETTLSLLRRRRGGQGAA